MTATAIPSLYEPLSYSTLKVNSPPCPPLVVNQIKRKPIGSAYSHHHHTSIDSSHTSPEVVESHGPEVVGEEGLIYMRDDDKHLSIQPPSTGTYQIYDEEGEKAKRRICERRICGMNVWVIIALVVFLVIGAVVGGVVGAIKVRDSALSPVATPEGITTPDSVPTVSSVSGSTSKAPISPTPTPNPSPKPRLSQPVDNTWYFLGTSNASLSAKNTGLYLTRDTGGALRSYPPTEGFEQDQTFQFKSFQSPSNALEKNSNKITQTWGAAQIEFQNQLKISKNTPLYILQHPLAKWSAILRYTNKNGLGDLHLESASYGNISSAAVDSRKDGSDGASKHNDPAVWFWLEDREDGKGFYLKNAAAGKDKALTLLNYNGKDQLVMSNLGITGVRNEDQEGVQAWNITETPKVEAYDWPYEW